MYVCVCMYVRMCVYVCMYACMYVCMYVCMCMYLCMYVRMCVYVCMYAARRVRIKAEVIRLLTTDLRATKTRRGIIKYCKERYDKGRKIIK